MARSLAARTRARGKEMIASDALPYQSHEIHLLTTEDDSLAGPGFTR